MAAELRNLDAQFVCAFRGRRDDYQVPLALEEADILSEFITDLYAKRPIASLTRVLTFGALSITSRCKSGIPDSKVLHRPSLALGEFLARDPSWRMKLQDRHDGILSALAATVARERRANLLLYSPYALPAFSMSYDHDPIKIIFQYHPHHRSERAILLEDDRKYGLSKKQSLESESTVVRPHRLRSDDAWRAADHIMCASSFTKRSLVEAGADPCRISVIGYGVARSRKVQPVLKREPFRVLFVGSGIQRKGIHHLLSAWNKADLPRSAELLIVARTLDRSLIESSVLGDNVRIVPRMSAVELAEAYRQASLFCMPSLVEGFGQVFVEALAEGLPVLGTRNSCLPDLGGEEDGIFLTEPGDVDDLAAQLERVLPIAAANQPLREAASRVAERCEWPIFRRKIQKVCLRIVGDRRGSRQ